MERTRKEGREYVRSERESEREWDFQIRMERNGEAAQKNGTSNDAEGKPILDGWKWIEELAFSVDLDTPVSISLREQVLNLYDRRLSDCVKDAT